MLKIYQKTLRTHPTEAEQYLWHYLRNRKFHGFKFRRQQVIQNYIVDFVCFEKNLVIEVDGSQHYDQKVYDENRSKNLNKEGFQVIRFWNNDIVENIESVLSSLYDILIKG